MFFKSENLITPFLLFFTISSLHPLAQLHLILNSMKNFCYIPPCHLVHSPNLTLIFVDRSLKLGGHDQIGFWKCPEPRILHYLPKSFWRP